MYVIIVLILIFRIMAHLHCRRWTSVQTWIRIWNPVVLWRTCSHCTDSDPYSLFLYRTGIRVRVRLRQCKWAIIHVSTLWGHLCDGKKFDDVNRKGKKYYVGFIQQQSYAYHLFVCRLLVLLWFQLQRSKEHALVCVIRELDTFHLRNKVAEPSQAAQAQNGLKVDSRPYESFSILKQAYEIHFARGTI